MACECHLQGFYAFSMAIFEKICVERKMESGALLIIKSKVTKRELLFKNTL